MLYQPLAYEMDFALFLKTCLIKVRMNCIKCALRLKSYSASFRKKENYKTIFLLVRKLWIK